ncbi:hypothetical protein SORBI_3010G095550 [Sorghum bicolor]|uniref:Uncharacterized protein n=1 Tax=Sorghum bicolor TaxID=4558 RepID=A0A1W0VS60_SORBI|nr:hypothetical protein SORBI_3010G095550 [Sorghum bicolor]
MHCEVPAPNYSTKSDEWVSCSAFCPGTSSERPEDHNASGLRSSPECLRTFLSQTKQGQSVIAL